MAASSDTFRCKDELVRVGDDKGSVLQKCGEPLNKDSFCKPADQNLKNVNSRLAQCETVNEWTYNPGSGQFMTTLRFEDGKLQAIKYGTRVK